MVAGSPIIDFIESLWGEDPLNGYLTIGFYKNGKPYRYKFLRNLDHFDIKEIMTLNKEKFDIYYEIGLQREVITEKGRRGSEKNVISIPGLWCNFDFIRDANKKENLDTVVSSALKIIDKFPLKPSIKVFTGESIHSYWLFKKPLILDSQNAFNHAKELSRRFQITIKEGNRNDIDNTSRLNHLLRLPGTLNHKQNSTKTYVMENNANRYNPEDFDYPSYDSKETDEKIKAAVKNPPGSIKCETLKSPLDFGLNCSDTSQVNLLKHKVETGTSQPIIQPIQAPGPSDDEDDDDFAELDVLKDRVPDRPFPWESLPVGLSECLKDLAKDMAVSPEMCSVIALAVLSAALGNAVEYVEAKKGYKTTVNLWVSVIAESGDKKSPILHRFLKPVFDLQHSVITAFKQQQQMQQSNAKKPAIQINSKPPSIYTTDPTLEGLIELLSDNTRGILLFQDEISGFLLSFDKYRAGKGGDREAYLNLWNSTPIKVDRVTKNLYLHRPFLVLVGGMQPKKAVRVFGEKSFDDGLISRFLFFNNEPSFLPLTNHTWSTNNDQLWTDLVTDLYKVPENTLKLTLENDAWEHFRNYTNSLEEMRQYAPDRFKVFIPKAITYALRLSGLLHVVDYTIKKTKPNNNISLSTVKNSIELTKFFLSQARKMAEHYAPKRPHLTKDQIRIISSIIDIQNKRNSFTLPVSEIHSSFNHSVSKTAQIKNDSIFGRSLRKTLKDLEIEFNSKRVKIDKNKNSIMCIEISQIALDQMKNKIK